MLPLFKVYMAPSVGEAVVKTLYSGMITQGPKVEEYEAALRAYLGLQHVVTVNSGTSALELALELAGVNAGDYVISTPQTCFDGSTFVRLADGTYRTIAKIVNNKEVHQVATFDPNTGMISSGTITGWTKTKSDNWYKIRLVSSSKNAGGGFKSVLVTGDHQILTTGGYKAVQNLGSEDFVITRFAGLTPTQKEVVYGTLLGDGYIQFGGKRNLAGRFGVGHTELQKEWLDLKLSALSNHDFWIRYYPAHKQSKPCYKAQSKSSPMWREVANQWYPEGRKVLPADFTSLSWLQVAIWYCDDGAMFNAHGALFCTDAFSEQDNQRLVDMLAELGVNARLGYRNRIYVDNAQTLFYNIARYVPECMRYKLGKEEHTLPVYDKTLWKSSSSTALYYSKVEVTKALPNKKKRYRTAYCVEVANTHNFVVGNMVVANCSATNTAIRSRQAHIVWSDIDPNTGNVTSETIKTALAHVPPGVSVKAIMMVHWGGLPCDVVGINEVARTYNLKTIEDAAHAFGAKVNNLPVGAYSDFTAFSTQAIKHLTTVDGGILVTKSEQDYKDAKLLRWFGIDREGPKTSFRCELDLVRPGHKFHMNDVNATIGIENLKHMDAVIGQHRANTYQMNKLLKHSPLGLTHIPYTFDSSCWLYTVRLPTSSLRDKFELYMLERGVQCSQVHAPNHKHTFTKRYGPKHLPGVEEFSSTQTNIPIGWWITPDDVRYIAKCALDFCALNIKESEYEEVP